ncbi:MAG: filamentous hemagglutinin N-terminal domain-containing protein [Cyanobacteria bacterium P01_H01_bin.130]
MMGFGFWMNRAIAGGVVAAGLGLGAGARAEVPIVPAQDGVGTRVDFQGDRAVITGGQVSSDGSNNFHSFSEFGVGTGQAAEFLGTPGLENILGRVVGGQRSLVDGTIRVTGTDANLFLLNPAGWVFGNGAQLDVPGAFTATTATAVEFGGGNLWGIGSEAASALTGNGSITGFYFDASVSGNIANFGTLAVAPGQGLNLLGMAVLNGGQLIAPGGTVLVEAVPESGFVRLAAPGQLLGLEFVPQAGQRWPSP